MKHQHTCKLPYSSRTCSMRILWCSSVWRPVFFSVHLSMVEHMTIKHWCTCDHFPPEMFHCLFFEHVRSGRRLARALVLQSSLKAMSSHLDGRSRACLRAFFMPCVYICTLYSRWRAQPYIPYGISWNILCGVWWRFFFPMSRYTSKQKWF